MHSLNTDLYDAKLSNALASKDWPLLVRLCRQALRKNARHLRAHRLLGFALNELRQTEGALTSYRQAAAFWPDDAELLINYANVLQKHGRHSEAGPILEKVCSLRPEHAISWIKLSQSCYITQQHEKGYAAAQKATERATSLADQVASLTQKSIHRRELGQIQEAVKDCEAAIKLFPQDPANHTNRLLFILADPDSTPGQITQAAKEFAEVFERPLLSTWPDFSSQRHGPWRRLKIGFISPDFRTHAVMYFIEGLLAQLDRSQFEVWAFYLYPSEDLTTQRVRCHADHFVQLSNLSIDEQLQSIRGAGIDILIDLAGHTGGNALLTLAHKAAPVQVTTIGYPGTTGLQAMDWWISDDITDPPGAEQWYTERLYRLPTRWTCYRPMSRNPLWRYQPAYQVSATPALRNGFVTFGCCNNLGKLTDEVLALWGRILKSVPSARLLIEGKNLDKPEFEQAYRSRCEALGIDINRLDLVPLDPKQQYLTYHRIDIALDPFPLVGGTTTNDLLWMGVPLVTMIGDSLRSRMGVGSLAYLGHHKWIARNAEEYVGIANALASDTTALNQIRQQLRTEFENSVLMREDVFVPEFGYALRRMWLQWLIESEHPSWSAEQTQTQIEAWLAEKPTHENLEFRVGIAPGIKITLSEAYAKLQELIDKAKLGQHTSDAPLLSLSSADWVKATELAEHILCAKPNDAVALTVLAEIENVHGHHEFGRVYLAQALKALGPQDSAEQVLERTSAYVRAALEYLGES